MFYVSVSLGCRTPLVFRLGLDGLHLDAGQLVFFRIMDSTSGSSLLEYWILSTTKLLTGNSRSISNR
jgi:hypothetical protein